MADPRWLVLTWRLPATSSTPRVTVWRTLRRLGAVTLTPGAAILPFSDDHLERLDWIAQDVDDAGGQAWVLPVTDLSAAEEARIRTLSKADRDAEYSRLIREAGATAGDDHGRHQASLRRQLEAVCARDHFTAARRQEAIALIGRSGRRAPAPRTRRVRPRASS